MAGLFNSGKAVDLPKPVKLQVGPATQTATLRPVQQDRGGNARALADALGSLNGSLSRFAEVDHAIKENPESLANREWVARAQQMNMEELQALAQSGEADGIRVREDAMNGLLGEKAVSDARAEITEHFNTGFDYTNGDATAEVDEIISRHASALPNDFARAAFTRGMGSFRQGYLDRVVQTKVEYAKGQVATAVVDSFRNTIDDAQGQGKSAEEVAALVFERSGSNRTFLGLSGQEQNETVLAIAEEAANRGDVELVNALLNGERKGADGAVVPALSRIAGYTSKATRLMDVARGRQTEKIERESFGTYETLNTQVSEGSFTDKEAAPLIANGTLTAKAAAAKVEQSAANRARIEAAERKAQNELVFAQTHERQKAAVLAEASHELETYAGVTNIQDVEVTSKTGEGTVKVSKKEIIDTAIARKEAALRDKMAQLIAQGTPEADADVIVNRDRVTFYAANALDNDAWKMQFNGVAAMVSPDVLAKGGPGAAQAQETAELYLQVAAQNPAYAEGLVTNAQSRDFLEAYELARNISQLPPGQAAIAASNWQALPETQKNRYRMDTDVRDKIATDVLNDSLSSFWNSGDLTGPNFALVRGRVEQLSRMNLPESVIKHRTQEYLEKSTVTVNGMIVETKGRTPPDFKELAEARLSRMFDEVKDSEFLEGAGKDDLYLVPSPSGGSWTVWSKYRRVPLPYSITEADFAAMRQADQLSRTTAAQNAAADSAQGRREKKETQSRLDNIIGQGAANSPMFGQD